MSEHRNGMLHKSGEAQKLHESLGFIVNGLGRLMRNALDVKLQGSDYTPTFWTVLMALGEEDNLSQTDLCRRTFLDGATMTRVLDMLEARGDIERQRGSDDRRVQIVRLTLKGRNAYKKYARLGIEVNDETAAVLTSEERKQLETWLQRTIENLLMVQNDAVRGVK